MTPLEAAEAAIADANVPDPSFIEEDLDPVPALVFIWEVSKIAMRVATASAVSLDANPDEEQPIINELLNGCAAALAGYTHALVALEVLPKEAEEAILRGAIPAGTS